MVLCIPKVPLQGFSSVPAESVLALYCNVEAYSPVIFAGAAHPNTAKLFIDYIRSLPGTNRMAETGVGLIYGRPGVSVPEKERKFMPSSEKIKVIPMDWDKDASTENLKATRTWAKKVGIGY